MKAAVELVGDDNFTWDSDYPHPDGTYPWGVKAMLDQPIPDESRRKLFWDNGARIFNLD
jgi:predicted TIM-barrel fold metal-dependent hydrolase